MKPIKFFCIVILIVTLCLSCFAGCGKKTENIPDETGKSTDAVQNEETEPDNFDDIGEGPYFVPLKSESLLGEDATDEEKEWFEIHTDSGCVYVWDENSIYTDTEREYVWEENSVSEYRGGTLRQKWEFDDRGRITSKAYFFDNDVSHVTDYDPDGKVTREIRYENGIVTETRIYEYDENGNQISETGYDLNIKIKFHVCSEYDKSGNKIRETQTEADGKLSQLLTYEYDENGNLTSYAVYRKEGGTAEWQSLYEYDPNGNKIKETSISKGEVYSIQIYEYDGEGNQTKCTDYGPSGSILWQDIYAYSEDGKSKIETRYDEDGALSYYLETREEYDAHGNRIKKVYCDEDGDISESYEYKYDENGNLIGKVSFTTWGGTCITSFSWIEASPAQYSFYIKGIENDWHSIYYPFDID